MRKHWARRFGVAGAFLVVGSVLGMWAMPTLAPVDRLATNVAAYVKEHPQDANGYYVLGRVHGLAFTLKTREIAVWENRAGALGVPEVAEDTHQYMATGGEEHPERAPTKPELTRHLAEAVKNDETAIRLNPAPAHYHLGLAFVLDTGGVLAEETDVIPGASGPALGAEASTEIERTLAAIAGKGKSGQAIESLRKQMPGAGTILLKHAKDEDAAVRDAVRQVLSDWWRERAIAAYFAAYERAITADLKIEMQPMRGLNTLVGYEAAEGYAKLVKARGVKDDDERKRLAKVQADIKTLRNKPANNTITPVIFAVDGERPLTDLLAPGSIVNFDLDGTARGQKWPWVRPDTGILVWDPEGKGKIESGRQLFGSVTWWMFFDDGFKALDALDDNRDGELAGAELAGMAVWFDRNGNGVSDAGEVVSLASAGITGISARATTEEDGCPANRAGLRMKDGRVLPTYDWIVRSVGSDS